MNGFAGKQPLLCKAQYVHEWGHRFTPAPRAALTLGHIEHRTEPSYHLGVAQRIETGVRALLVAAGEQEDIRPFFA